MYAIRSYYEPLGANASRMVDDLTRIGTLTDLSSEVKPGDEEEHAENLRRLLLGIAEDVRVVLVVVAQQLHLMRSARSLSPELRQRLAEETRDIYAPLANRLGVWQVKWELEDLSRITSYNVCYTKLLRCSPRDGESAGRGPPAPT